MPRGRVPSLGCTCTAHLGVPAACHCQKGQPSHSPLPWALPISVPQMRTCEPILTWQTLLTFYFWWGYFWAGQAVSVGASFQHLEEIEVSQGVWAGQSTVCSTWELMCFNFTLVVELLRSLFLGGKSPPPLSRIHSATIYFSLCRASELRQKNQCVWGHGVCAPYTKKQRPWAVSRHVQTVPEKAMALDLGLFKVCLFYSLPVPVNLQHHCFSSCQQTRFKYPGFVPAKKVQKDQ